jgi:hypothetical protein
MLQVGVLLDSFSEAYAAWKQKTTAIINAKRRIMFATSVQRVKSEQPVANGLRVLIPATENLPGLHRFRAAATVQRHMFNMRCVCNPADLKVEK